MLVKVPRSRGYDPLAKVLEEQCPAISPGTLRVTNSAIQKNGFMEDAGKL
jgi:hypothetical protein